jgi:tetratricopeptide (TPR) repeat protein
MPIQNEITMAGRCVVVKVVDELLEYALSVAGKVDKAYAKAFNYSEIASIYLEYGQKSRCQDILAENLKIVDLLKHPAEKAERLAWIGRVYAESGDITKAKEAFSRATLLAKASAPAESVAGLYRVACEYLDSNLKDDANSITSELYKAVIVLENDIDKALELINIADIYAETGQTEKAREVLDQALRISATIKDGWFKAERLTDIAQEYLDIGLKEQAGQVMIDALAAANSVSVENRFYFLLKMVDLYFKGDEKTKAQDTLAALREVVNGDESAYSKSKDLIEMAERYWELGDKEASFKILDEGMETIQTIQEIEDKITCLAEIADVFGNQEQKGKALDIAGQALKLCEKVENKKTAIYLMGTIALLFVQLNSPDKAAETVTAIIKALDESFVKTVGLGAVVIDLAAAGEFELALRLVNSVKDAHIKSSAIVNIAKSLAESDREPSDEVARLVSIAKQ